MDQPGQLIRIPLQLCKAPVQNRSKLDHTRAVQSNLQKVLCFLHLTVGEKRVCGPR